MSRTIAPGHSHQNGDVSRRSMAHSSVVLSITFSWAVRATSRTSESMRLNPQ